MIGRCKDDYTTTRLMRERSGAAGPVLCRACGTENEESAGACGVCGNSLYDAPLVSSSKEPEEAVDAAEFMGRSASYRAMSWQNYKAGKL